MESKWRSNNWEFNLPFWPVALSARFLANPNFGISWFRSSTVSTLFSVQIFGPGQFASILGVLPTTGGGGKFPFGFAVEGD